MKGLIKKDLICVLSFSKSYIFLLVFSAVFSVLGLLSPFYIPSMIVMMGGLVSTSLYAYDDAAKWNKFAIAAPVTRKQIVLSRYLSSIIIISAFTVIACALATAVAAITKRTEGFSEIMLFSLGMMLSFVFLLSIISPFINRFGYNNMKYFVSFSAVIFYILFFFLYSNSKLMQGIKEVLSGINIVALAFGLFILIMMLYFASFAISAKLFKKREF